MIPYSQIINLNYYAEASVHNVKTSIRKKGERFGVITNEIVSIDKLNVLKYKEGSLTRTKLHEDGSIDKVFNIKLPEVMSDEFGYSMCMNHDATKIFISDPSLIITKDYSELEGVVYFYEYNILKSEYELVDKFLPETNNDPNQYVRYGKSISCDLDGDQLVIGSFTNSNVDNIAHLYTRKISYWKRTNIDLEPTSPDGVILYCSVSMNGDGTKIAVVLKYHYDTIDNFHHCTIYCIGRHLFGELYTLYKVSKLVKDLWKVNVAISIHGYCIVVSETKHHAYGIFENIIRIHKPKESIVNWNLGNGYLKEINVNKESGSEVCMERSGISSICFGSGVIELGLQTTIRTEEPSEFSNVVYLDIS